ncbi:MAG TPA: hypothetical protein VII77_00240, partial [Candidatus Deferrimicrobium sp.]
MHDALKEAQFSPDRPVTRMLHDSPEMRVVVFGLEAGQEVPPHSVPVRVLMHVLQGKGVFLTGFVMMVIFGIAYHILPRFAGKPLHSEGWAAAHFWLA